MSKLEELLAEHTREKKSEALQQVHEMLDRCASEEEDALESLGSQSFASGVAEGMRRAEIAVASFMADRHVSVRSIVL